MRLVPSEVPLSIALLLVGVSAVAAGVVIGYSIAETEAEPDIYTDSLYQERLDTMELVAREILPVKNQTMILTNLGFESDVGGWIIKVNCSCGEVNYYVMDGWTMEQIWRH